MDAEEEGPGGKGGPTALLGTRGDTACSSGVRPEGGQKQKRAHVKHQVTNDKKQQQAHAITHTYTQARQNNHEKVKKAGNMMTAPPFTITLHLRRHPFIVLCIMIMMTIVNTVIIVAIVDAVFIFCYYCCYYNRWQKTGDRHVRQWRHTL